MIVVAASWAAWAQAAGPAIEPADPQLIPEARAVLTYLGEIYGTRTLSGAWGTGNVLFAQEATGRLPAIQAFDLTGWNSPTWGKTYTPVVQNSMDKAKVWWRQGGLVAMQFHWKHPGNLQGSAWVGKHGAAPADIEGATHWGYRLQPVFSSDPGDAGEPGEVETLITHYTLQVIVYGQDDTALLALLGAVASDFVGGYKGAAGANRKKTIKNVYFNSGPSQVEAPPKDAGGKVPVFQMTGSAQWGAADTPATMIVDAPDA